VVNKISGLVVLLFLITGVVYGASDWSGSLSPVMPGSFPPPRPLVATYSFGWAGFTAGRADAAFSRMSGDRLRVEVKGGTTGFVRVLWRMDALHLAVADVATLLPSMMSQEEDYRGETRKTGLVFTGSAVTGTVAKTTVAKSLSWQVHFKYPALRDMHCALLYLRSQKLEPGSVYNLTVYPATSPFLVTARVIGKEKVEVPAGEFDSIRVDLRLWKITGDLRLETAPKCKHAVVWVSDDADRIPLKAQADVFIGSVWGQLEEVKHLKP